MVERGRREGLRRALTLSWPGLSRPSQFIEHCAHRIEIAGTSPAMTSSQGAAADLPPGQPIREQARWSCGRPRARFHSRIAWKFAVPSPIRRAGLPAVDLQQIGRRGQHVRHAVAQIDVAVAVEVDAVLDVGRRQELGLADLAGIGADQIARAAGRRAARSSARRSARPGTARCGGSRAPSSRATRITGSLPMSPVPKSVSSPQIATITCGGTPNCCSMRDEQRGVALHHRLAAS